MKSNGLSHQSKLTTKRERKCLNQQKYFRLLISDIELCGDENESKKEPVEIFFKS